MPLDSAPTLAPCRDTMLTALHAIYADAPPDAIAELAYEDWTGAVSRAMHFRANELEKFADAAAELNAHPGINVYYGAALRKPDTPHGKRTGKKDVLGTRLLWSDNDDDAEGSRQRWAAAKLSPCFVVVTRRWPQKRTQAIWRLSEFMQDQAEIERRLEWVCALVGGDKAVVDCSRVLRLPGSVSWPTKKKPERRVERVEWHCK